MRAKICHGTQILIIRHGEVFNPEDILYGRLRGYHISEDGRRQAEITAQALRYRNIAAVYCSPQLRAIETARIIAAEHPSLKIQIMDGLKEVDSFYEGKPLKELREGGWDLYTGIPPEFEQPEDVFERIQKVIEEIRQ